MDRKPKFRSKKIDFHKAITVYRYFEVPDLDESASVSRNIAAIPTGVDKEEEEEHHLQIAISAAQLNTAPVYIPTPKASTKSKDYNALYKSGYKQPKSLIRFSTLIEDCVSIPYDIDDFDANWLKEKADKIGDDQFEMIMSHFEKVAVNKGVGKVTVDDLDQLLNIAMVADTIKNYGKDVFEYWKNKREKKGRPLNILVNADGVALTPAGESYVCFRKREIKGQRKTRRTDAQCLEKLKKLRVDLESAKNLLELVLKRDKFKKESLMLDSLIFEQTLIVENLKKKCDPKELEAISELRPIFEKKKSYKRLKQLEEESNGEKMKMKNKDHGRKDNKMSVLKRQPSIPGKTDKLEPLSSKFEVEYAHSQYLLSNLEKDLIKRKKLDEYTVEFTYLSESRCRNEMFFERNSLEGLPIGRCRIGRGGRVLYDRGRQMDTHDEITNEIPDISSKLDNLRMLSAEDMQLLNNSSVLNYNQHYINYTKSILKPIINYQTMIVNTISPKTSAPRSSVNKAINVKNLNVTKKKVKKDKDLPPGAPGHASFNGTPGPAPSVNQPGQNPPSTPINNNASFNLVTPSPLMNLKSVPLSSFPKSSTPTVTITNMFPIKSPTFRPPASTEKKAE